MLEPLNRALTPAIRLGVGNPLPLTTGFVILEVPGRKTGTLRSVPLLCTDYGSALLISTVRGDSQWVRNLAAAGKAEVWLRGRKRAVTAHVYRRGEPLTAKSPGNPWAQAARLASRLTGASVAALIL